MPFHLTLPSACARVVDSLQLPSPTLTEAGRVGARRRGFAHPALLVRMLVTVQYDGDDDERD